MQNTVDLAVASRRQYAVTEATEREIRIYVTSEGKAPFEDWVTALRDKRAKARILSRIDRVRLGNFGDCRSAGAGVY